MTQEAEKSKVLKDVIEALSSAGISSEITDVVTSNLLDGNQQSDAPIDNLPLSDNARFIIEKRYLQRDKSGNPYEDADGLFHRVANAVSLGADAPKQQE